MIGVDVDVDRLADVATGFEKSSEALGSAVSRIEGCVFGPALAGRNYADVGGRIETGFDTVESMFARWSEAVKADAVALRGSVASYTGTDTAAANAVGEVGGR